MSPGEWHLWPDQFDDELMGVRTTSYLSIFSDARVAHSLVRRAQPLDSDPAPGDRSGTFFIAGVDSPKGPGGTFPKKSIDS